MNREVFVFGSNLAGKHIGGSARAAYEKHGAIWGKGVGPQGESYAIPTLNEGFEPLPIPLIARYVEDFFEYALWNPFLTFKIVAIGCGVAGFKAEDIAPIFQNAPHNCVLSSEFKLEKSAS